MGSEFRVAALAARNNVERLAEQVRRFRPRCAAIANSDKAAELRSRIGDVPCEILAGPDAATAAAALDGVEVVLTAMVGAAGLPPVLEAARRGRTLAIANKEPLVIAGELLTRTARRNGARVLPVDSEHSAVFQALQAGRREELSRIVLTASGGPFRKATPEQLDEVTLEEALAHPTWEMGPKITVDSATMMNKALEVIEAVWLFDVPPEQVEVLIHPESIVHSMVEFVDGSVIAQLGRPDMTVPIQYALTYPRRCAGLAAPLRLEEVGRLTFEKPNPRTFRSLALAYDVVRAGGSAPVTFNAANEVAVEEFLAGRIRFTRIMELVEECLNRRQDGASLSLEELMAADERARRQARELLANGCVSRT